MGTSPEQVAREVGTQLCRGRLNKEGLVKLLKQGATALSELKQSASYQSALAPLCKSLVQSSILEHKDKEVRLLVAVCLSEIIRVLAPNPPFVDDHHVLKDIFKLFINIFGDLAEVNSPHFTRRVKILENFAAVNLCLLMLDIGCDKLIKEMLDVFFAVIRNEHQKTLVRAMSSVMALILEEKVSPALLNLVLRNLLKDEKGESSASSKLAVSVIQNSAEKLKPLICKLLTSLIMEKDDVGTELAGCYHDIISRIFQFDSQMLVSVIPNLAHELIMDQVDVRIKAVTLVGKLFVHSNSLFAGEFHSLFAEFINRFADKSTEVRLRAVECAKTCYLCNTTAPAAKTLLSALEERLLDTDEKVRGQVVTVLVDLAASNLKSFPSNLVLKTVERIRDKKVTVRKKTMTKLLELYRAYCLECSEGFLPITDHFEQIPPKIFLLCFDKDCKEFRPQNMELVVSEDLFPPSLSVEERTRHFTYFSSSFSFPHKKALASLLSQKKRLQMEFKVYASLGQDKQDKILASIEKMAGWFMDSSKAVECLQKLHQAKDNHIFEVLLELVDERTNFARAKSIRDSFLDRIGAKNPNYEFYRTLSIKCSNSIFTCEHVHFILQRFFCSKENGSMPESSSSLELLTTILNIFPSLLSGSEVLFIKLYGELYIAKETLLHILARAAPQMSVSLSDIYPFLERVCLEGAASEAKYAVSTIASLTDSQGSSMLSKLFQKLVSNLRHDQNLATVLQCLLCMLKHSLLAVASLNDLADEVFCKFFSPKKTASSEDFNTNPLCNLKGFALKLLVKIFLTTKTTEVKLQQVKDLMVILHNTLKSQEAVNNVTTSRGNLDQLSLTAAKSVLRLSSRWDLHIVPQLFHLTVLMARYPSPAIQKEFLNKTHDLLGKRALPIRFSCTYALIPLQSSAELQGEAHKYMAEFIQEYSHRTLVCKDPSLRNLDREKLIHCSEYIVVYLIHVLAHVQSFPSQISEQDMNVDFIGPLLLLLRALLVPYTESSDKDVGGTVSFLLGIFRAIRKAEDAVDADITPKLHVLADIGLLMTKELSHDLKVSPDGPGMILLPSAFYKISNNIRSRENSAYEHLISEPCIKKMVRLQEDDKVFDFKSEKIQNLASDRKVELTSTGKENSDECQTKLLVAQTVELCNEISENKSTIQEPVPEVHRCSDPESSCGSAITRPFSNSQVAAGQVDLATGHEHKIHRVAPTRRAIEKTKGNSYKKDLNASDEALVGSRISLWSPLNKCFCSGMVDSYDSENKSHKVTYDNGNIEQLHLNCERWEIISSTCSTDKETPHFNGSMVSSDARLKLFDDIFEDNSSQEDPIVGRKSSAKKKPEVSVSATGSLRRSKRLKKT